MLSQSKLDRILAEWAIGVEEMSASSGFARLVRKDMGVEHYASMLRQIYLQVREHPQMLAALTLRLHGPRRESIGSLLKHAISEQGHDKLALRDLRSLGQDVSDLAASYPLPGTIAMLAYGQYQIDHANPVGYLGYLFHLEFLPTRHGEEYGRCLAEAGVPREAMSFLADHVEVDVAHNKLMERYLEQLVLTEEDVIAVGNVARTSAVLYGRMIADAFDEVDKARGRRDDPRER